MNNPERILREPEIETAIGQARVPNIPELHEQFEKMKPKVLRLAPEGKASGH